MNLVEYHTIVCGTSKSKCDDGYYINEKKKFWGGLYEAGVTENEIDPYKYRELGRKYGIYLTEVVDEIISQDWKIKAGPVEKGLEKLLKFLKGQKPKRVLFHGKKAAAWFYQKINNTKITKNVGRITKEFEYGPQCWGYNDTKIYILPSTSGAANQWWDRKKWHETWKNCLDDVRQFKARSSI